MVHPMLLPLTSEAQARHPAKLTIEVMAEQLSELLEAAYEVNAIAQTGRSAIHQIVSRFEATSTQHERRSRKAWSIATSQRTSYRFYAKGRALASSLTNSLVYAKDELYVHRQALQQQSNRMDDLSDLLDRFHAFALFETGEMEEATDLSYDIDWLARFTRPAANGEHANGQTDDPGLEDAFGAEDTDEDSEPTGEPPVPAFGDEEDVHHDQSDGEVIDTQLNL
jgi:hypothetical protein